MSLKKQEENQECVKKVKDILSELGAPPHLKFHAIHCVGKPNIALYKSTGGRSTFCNTPMTNS